VKVKGKRRGAKAPWRTTKRGEIARRVSAGAEPAHSELPTSPPAATASQPERAVATFAGPVDALEKAKALARAELAMKSSANAASVVLPFAKGLFGDQDLWALSEALKDSIAKVQEGDMRQGEAMLMGQAVALQSIFTYMARRILSQELLERSERLFAMALKAQNQCRMTLETLNELKHPRQATFVRAAQANIAQQQQVNNGARSQEPSRAREIESAPNKLLEEQGAERMDTRAPCAAVGSNSAMETVGSINGTDNGQG
jgi:hypothetical protein